VGQGKRFDPGKITVDWFIWRPIIAKVTTLREIEESWSIDDLLDAHEALDIQQEHEAWAAKQPRDK
jgi:hypothetical protein